MELGLKESAKFSATWLFDVAKRTLLIQEVMKVLEISDDQVRAHIKAGNFLAIGIGDNPNPQREHLRVWRFSVEAWALNQLEDEGQAPPMRDDPQITWWRGELRKRERLRQLADEAPTEKQAERFARLAERRVERGNGVSEKRGDGE